VHGGETLALEQLARSVTAKPSYVALFEKPKTSCTSLSPSTTALSPYMSLGCLSPRTVWNAIQEAQQRSSVSKPSQPPVSLHGQILWRDFNNLMAHSAGATWSRIEGNPYCRPVPWDYDEDMIQKWKKGETGYPWIDACMKQLAQEGWIHHLGRHAVACFLTRGDLWQSWEQGALHFESHLLDADYALNGFNWLWLSCSGFFYQYFRCYSPIAFQQRNDPSGNYIRKYLPVLSKLPDKYIYEPWKTPIAVQKTAGIQVGVDYPKPIVDHAHVSKENMSKMAAAYDAFKESQDRIKSSKRGSDSEGDQRKKKKQTKLKF
jgi:cryptochrome